MGKLRTNFRAGDTVLFVQGSVPFRSQDQPWLHRIRHFLQSIALLQAFRKRAGYIRHICDTGGSRGRRVSIVSMLRVTIFGRDIGTYAAVQLTC